MSGNLDSYRRKRDFSATPEPSGGADESAEGRTARFVVQEHHARALHWDLRLEHDGALASWAVPKGIPPDPRRNNLAVRTEDHPLEYLDFHGDIPAGRVRRRDDEDLGPRDLRDAQVARGRGDGHLPRRAPPRPLRPVPHRRQELDDPPDGSARGSGPRADAQADRADARPHGRAPQGRRELGVRDQVGRRARDRLRRRRPPAARGPQRARHHAALPGAAQARPSAGGPRRDRRRRGRRLRRRPAELPEAPGAHAPDLREPRPAAVPERPGQLRPLRPAVARRPLADRPAVHRAPRAAARARPPGRPLADARAPRRRRRGDARGLAGRRGSRASSPSGSTPRTTRASARTAG